MRAPPPRLVLLAGLVENVKCSVARTGPKKSHSEIISLSALPYEHRFIPWSKASEEETTGHELAEGEAVVGTAELRMDEAMERMQVQV